MTLMQEIEFALHNSDGGCRDINFEEPSWHGATELIKWFCQNYRLRFAYTEERTDIKAELANALNNLPVPQPEGYFHLVGENPNAVITELQVFIANQENGTPFVELTFFPDHLNPKYLGIDFIHFVEEMNQRLQAKRYFVRYENGSWIFGTSGFGTGVIFQTEDVKDVLL